MMERKKSYKVWDIIGGVGLCLMAWLFFSVIVDSCAERNIKQQLKKEGIDFEKVHCESINPFDHKCIVTEKIGTYNCDWTTCAPSEK